MDLLNLVEFFHNHKTINRKQNRLNEDKEIKVYRTSFLPGPSFPVPCAALGPSASMVTIFQVTLCLDLHSLPSPSQRDLAVEPLMLLPMPATTNHLCF
jgi:hypothetical protein